MNKRERGRDRNKKHDHINSMALTRQSIAQPSAFSESSGMQKSIQRPIHFSYDDPLYMYIYMNDKYIFISAFIHPFIIMIVILCEEQQKKRQFLVHSLKHIISFIRQHRMIILIYQCVYMIEHCDRRVQNAELSKCLHNQLSSSSFS